LSEKEVDKISKLIKKLKSKDEKIHEKAKKDLIELGKKTDKVIPFLIEAIKDKDEEVRIRVINVLYGIRENVKKAIPALIEALKDNEETVRVKAGESLIYMKEGLEKAITVIVEELKAKDGTNRLIAALALISIDVEVAKALRVMMKALKNKDEKIRGDACFILWTSSTYTKKVRRAIPALIKTLRDKNVTVREMAALSFVMHVNIKPWIAVPALIRALRDEELSVCVYAARSLEYLGIQLKKAVPILIKGLDDKDSMVRWNSAFLLGRMGKKSEIAIPALISALKDKERKVRINVAFALCDIGTMPLSKKFKLDFDERYYGTTWSLNVMEKEAIKGIVPVLIDAIKDKEQRVQVVRCLEEMGDKAALAAPALAEVLKDEKVRYKATSALSKIGRKVPKETMPLLDQYLDDKDKKMQKSVLDVLGQTGEKFIKYASWTAELLKEDDMAYEAFKVLAGMGDKTVEKFMPAIIDAFEHKRLSYLSIFDLSRYEKALDPILTVMKKSKNPEIIQLLSFGLRFMSRHTKKIEKAIPVLEETKMRIDDPLIQVNIPILLEIFAKDLGYNNYKHYKQSKLSKKEIDALEIEKYIGNLNSIYTQKRQIGAYRLGEFGEDATEAINPLKDLLLKKMENTLVREFTALSLGRIKSEEAVRWLRIVKTNKERVKLAVEGALYRLEKIPLEKKRLEKITKYELSLDDKFEKIHIKEEDLPETWWGKNKEKIIKAIIGAVGAGIGAIITWVFELLAA